jgi:hypothetical protein
MDKEQSDRIGDIENLGELEDKCPMCGEHPFIPLEYEEMYWLKKRLEMLDKIAEARDNWEKDYDDLLVDSEKECTLAKQRGERRVWREMSKVCDYIELKGPPDIHWYCTNQEHGKLTTHLRCTFETCPAMRGNDEQGTVTSKPKDKKDAK